MYPVNRHLRAAGPDGVRFVTEPRSADLQVRPASAWGANRIDAAGFATQGYRFRLVHSLRGQHGHLEDLARALDP